MIRQEPHKFVQRSYNINNQSGIGKFTPFLESKGFTVPDKEEDYNVDIFAYKNGKEYRFEIEIKNVEFTTRETFPFDTVSFLSRKEKYHKDQPFWYVIISPKTNWFLMCNSQNIYKEEYKEVVHIDTLYRKETITFTEFQRSFVILDNYKNNNHEKIITSNFSNYIII